MSQRPITGYLWYSLDDGQTPNVVNTPTVQSSSRGSSNSTPDDQSNDSILLSHTSVGNQTVTPVDGNVASPLSHVKASSKNAVTKDQRARKSKNNSVSDMAAHRVPSKSSRTTNDMACQIKHVTDTISQNDIVDRSLTDMLESAFSSDSAADSNDTRCTSSSLVEQIVMIDSKLIHSEMKLEQQCADNISLKNQVELLHSELEQCQKSSNKQKQEIKKLMNENDRLRRDPSRFNGMRSFTESTNADSSDIKHELDITKAKLTSLRENLTGLSSRMIDVLEDGPTKTNKNNASDNNDHNDTPFTLVMHSKQGRRLLQQQHRASQPAPVPQPPRPTPPITPHPRGQPIPVICGVTTSGQPEPLRHGTPHGTNLQQLRHSSTRQTRGRAPPPIDTVIIGTSLTRGLGPKLSAFGTQATCYTYAGATIPCIRSRISNIIPGDSNPRLVVLQCGGNDAEHESSHKVTREYDALIGEIQQRCPRASIMLSKIPPRKNNKGMLDNISRVNAYLQHRASEGDDVSIMDVCPQDPALYRNDLVHFNTKGCRVYAKLMHSKLSHFTRCPNHVFR